MSRVAERSVRVAVTPGHGERAIVAAHGHDLRRPRRQGAVGIGDAVERLVVDRESIESVRRRVGRLGDHGRDRHALGPNDPAASSG